VTAEEILAALAGTISIAATMREPIEAMRRWAATRARCASPPEVGDVAGCVSSVMVRYAGGGSPTMKLDRITVNPAVCSGKPCIRGMRFPVYQVIELVAAGNSFAKILEDYPALEEEDLRQALAYAAKLARDGRGSI